MHNLVGLIGEFLNKLDEMSMFLRQESWPGISVYWVNRNLSYPKETTTVPCQNDSGLKVNVCQLIKGRLSFRFEANFYRF